jgi:hypothetical protein
MAHFLSPFESFCARAMDRNAALTGRLLEKMAQEKKSVAILIAGGFHTEGLMATLAKQGASVAVLTPENRPSGPPSPLPRCFAQDPLPLEKIFNGEPISLKTECPMGGNSFSGFAIRESVHAGIVLSSLNTLRQKLNSSGENFRDMRQTLDHYLEEMKGTVRPLDRIPLAIEAVTAEGVSLRVGDATGYSLATAKGNSNEVSIVGRGGVSRVEGPERSDLLTRERRQRNEAIAEYTIGLRRVLYLAAGFDLSNVLTTFPQAIEVV